jgi:hypothetical protein
VTRGSESRQLKLGMPQEGEVDDWEGEVDDWEGEVDDCVAEAVWDSSLLLAKSEDDLQYSVHNFNKIASEFSMETNARKLELWNQLEVRYALIIRH